MIVNGYKAGGKIEFLSKMAEVSEEEVTNFLRKNGIL
jgi:hypothetical protein